MIFDAGHRYSDMPKGGTDVKGISCALAVIGMTVLAGAEGRGADPVFTYGWSGVPAGDVAAEPGEVRTFEVFATLTTENNSDAIGPQGWIMSIAVIGATVKSHTLKMVMVDAICDIDDDGDWDTPPLHYDHYDFDLGGVNVGGDAFFSVSQAATSDYDHTGVNRPPPPGLRGVISYCVMGGYSLACLQPNGTSKVLKITIEATAPASVAIRYVDNLKGQGQPVPNAVTFSSYSYGILQGLQIEESRFTVGAGSGGFLRGDANADGFLEISDPIIILTSHFLGIGEIPCGKAADADDGGGMEVTDAVLLLGYLFLDGAAPSGPWGYCGLDPTPDDLPCEDFPACR